MSRHSVGPHGWEDPSMPPSDFVPKPDKGWEEKQTGKLIEEQAAEIERLNAYADKLAAGLPEGMLPKDVELLRQTNLDLIQQRDELEAQVKHLHKVVGIERDAANDALGRLEQIEGLAKRRDER